MAKEKGSIDRLRIKKRTYIFNVKKKVEYVKHYGIPKEPPPKNPIEMFGRLMRGEKGIHYDEKKKEVPRGPRIEWERSIFMKLFAVFAVLALLAVAGLVYLASNLPPGGPGPAPTSVDSEFNFDLKEASIVTHGGRADGKHVAYFTFSYFTRNMSNVSIDARLYGAPVPKQIFLLHYNTYEGISLPQFKQALAEGLAGQGRTITEISASELDYLPGNSVLVVPTGYFPTKLAGMEDANFSFATLMERGVTIVYVGYLFENALAEGGGTRSFSNAGAYGLTFERTSVLKCDPALQLKDPTYSVKRTERLQKERLLFGCISVVPYAQGKLVFLPKSLDKGWPSGYAAADDVIAIIGSDFGEPRIDNFTKSYDAEVIYRRTDTVYSQPFSGETAYLKLYVEGTDRAGKKTGFTKIMRLEKNSKGELYSRAGSVVPSFLLTGKEVELEADLREAEKRNVGLKIQTWQYGRMVGEKNIFTSADISSGTKYLSYPASFTPGKYVLKLVSLEDSNGDYPFASADIEIQDFQIERKEINFPDGRFTFGVKDGQGRPVAIKAVNITIDDKLAKQISDDQGMTAFTIEAPGLAQGKHTFKFSLAAGEKTLTEEYYKRVNFWENPIVIFLALMALAVFGVGYYLHKPEVGKFSLDVPDFPPLAQVKVPVKSVEVLSLFDQINKDYSWGFMPLTLEELKRGFRTHLAQKGKPILIGDYNLERILDKLGRDGKVKERNGYYALADWEYRSGKTIDFLMTFRQLRDTFINNVVHFTPLGERDDCETFISVGKPVYVHTYQGAETINRVLQTATAGMTFIVFKDEGEKESFSELLVTTNIALVELKMEIAGKHVYLVGLDKLDSLLKSLKG